MKGHPPQISMAAVAIAGVSLHPLELRRLRYQQVVMDEKFLFQGHRHRDLWEMVIGLKGITGVRLGEGSVTGREAHLKPGQMIMVPPDLNHLIWDGASQAPGPSAYFNIWFQGHSELAAAICGRVLTPRAFRPRFWEGQKSFPGGKPPEEYMAAQLMLLLCHLRDQAPDFVLHHKNGKSETTRQWSGAPPNPENPGQPLPLRQAMERRLWDLIGGEPGRLHKRSEMAMAFGLDPSHLSNKWRQSTGETLMVSYFRLKIRQSKDLLESGQTVKNVAEACGFASPFHFSRKFKELTGKTPSSWK